VDEREIENADNLEDALDEQGRNLTQQRMDAEGVEDRPVDVGWTAPERGKAPAAGGEADVVFEPDVPLAAEVSREAGEATDRKRRFAALGVLAAFAALLVRRRRR
jgi:MYXO-CTERM domain-containing protein